jgi:hypothetical protein
MPLRALVCAAVLGLRLGLARSVPGQGVVVGSDDARLINASLSGLTQRQWRNGRSEWKDDDVPIKVMRVSDWCEFGKRLGAYIAAGGSMYDYVDAAFEREYSGKLVLVTQVGQEPQPWCGPPLTLSSDGKERYWPNVLMCRYARGVLQLRPSRAYVGWFAHLHSGDWWAGYEVSPIASHCVHRPLLFASVLTIVSADCPS